MPISNIQGLNCLKYPWVPLLLKEYVYNRRLMGALPQVLGGLCLSGEGW